MEKTSCTTCDDGNGFETGIKIKQAVQSFFPSTVWEEQDVFDLESPLRSKDVVIYTHRLFKDPSSMINIRNDGNPNTMGFQMTLGTIMADHPFFCNFHI